MKFISKLLFVSLCFSSFGILFNSCQADLISEPNIKTITDSSSSKNAKIEAPVTVSATHGGIRTVTLSWSASNGAARYLIYSAATPYEDMELCGETKPKSGATTFTINEDAGLTRYYAVKAVNYSDEISELSSKVTGSTLAIPIITGISALEGGKSSTVNWWMDNCSEKTYQDIVRYEVDCYLADNTSTPVATLTASGAANSVTFTGLESGTNYFYQITAFTTYNQTAFEISDMLDAETAHRLIPDAVKNLSATKGTNRNYIDLEFDLPSFTDFQTTAGGYEGHPAYFKIFRKAYDAPDSEYEMLVSYLGTLPQTSDTDSDSIYVFSCSDSTKMTINDASGKTIVEVDENSPDQDTSYNANYPDYLAYTHIHFYDYTNLVRGTQYTYKIQSYTDESGKVIYTSDTESTAVTDGWLISVPDFRVNSSYTTDEDNQNSFNSLKISFTTNFEDFNNKNYQYILEQTYNSFEINALTGNITAGSETKSILKTAASLSSIASYTLNFNKTELSEKQGYYKFALYIVNQSLSTIPDDYETNPDVFAWANQNGKITVTDNASLLPDVSSFEVEDGWSSKYLLSWDYNENNAYSISWVDYNPDNTVKAEGNLELSDSDLTINENTAIYAHTAEPGTKRKYTFTANAGLSDSITKEPYYYTLGKAIPAMKDIDYKSITVTWPEVVKPENKNVSYSIKAEYKDVYYSSSILLKATQSYDGLTPVLLDANGIELSDNIVSTKNTNGLYQVTLKNPAGSNDPEISGKAINFTVTASIAERDSTEGSTEVKTLGPALINTKINSNGNKANYIEVSWTKVEGAKGYLINRIRHDESKSAEKADLYYYDVTTNKLSVASSGDASTEAATVNISGNNFTLNDSYCEPSGDESLAAYEDNQTKIAWGFEYSYTVLPVLSKNDFIFDTSCNENSPYTLSDDSTNNYSNASAKKNLSYVHGATFGYGLKVSAAKSASGKTQTVSWTAPYYTNVTETGFSYTPSLYRKETGSNANWQKVTSASLDSTKTSFNYQPAAAERFTAYEYAVRYNDSVNTKFVNSYEKNLKETWEYRYSVNTEQLNKGYLLAMDFTANYGGIMNSSGTYEKDENYYSEIVSWDPWDDTYRAIKPTSASITIINYNFLSPSVKVADINTSTYIASPLSLTDTNATADNNSLRLAPAGITNNTKQETDGVLKVLRDAKHYYEIYLESENGSATEGEDLSKYAYRQITDTELIKTTMLIIAEIVKDTKMETYTTGTVSWFTTQIVTMAGYSGSFGWSQDASSKFNWYINDYVQGFTDMPGIGENLGYSIPAFITISDPNNSGSNERRGKKSAGSLKFLCYDETSSYSSSKLIPLTVSSSTIPLESYTGIVKFAASNSNFAAQVSHNGTTTFTAPTISSNENETKTWCPVSFDSNGYQGKSTTYGWWPKN